MNESPARTYFRSLALGLVSGMRSMMAPALAARMASEDPEGMPHVLVRSQTRTALGVMAAGELVIDKLPFTPSRTVMPSLVLRCISGGLMGAVCAASRRGRPGAGAVVGALGAIAGAFGARYARRLVEEKLKVADPIIGLAEDVLAAGIGMKALKA